MSAGSNESENWATGSRLLIMALTYDGAIITAAFAQRKATSHKTQIPRNAVLNKSFATRFSEKTLNNSKLTECDGSEGGT